jgi:hypothetical protein
LSITVEGRPRNFTGLGALDGLCMGLSVLLLAPLLGYPLGRDQSVFAYVAREWTRGGLPYRDVFDHKPPGVYAVYALARAVGGAGGWPVRVLELAALLGMGWLVALAVARDRCPRPGERGAAALLCAGMYATTFDWAATGQPEVWEGMLLVASFVVARRARTLRWAAGGSGALLGAALLFKHPAMIVGVVTISALVARFWEGTSRAARLREGARAAAWHLAAACAVLACAACYFVVRGGATEAYDACVGYLLQYPRTYRCKSGVANVLVTEFWLHRARLWAVLGGLGLASVAIAAWRRRARRELAGAAWSGALFAAAVLSVVVQRRYLQYHWVIVTPFVVLGIAEALGALGRARWAAAPAAAAVAVVALGVATGPRWHVNDAVDFRSATVAFWEYRAGVRDRARYLGAFVWKGYSYPSEERVAAAIRARARPGDGLIVRGHSPNIYLASGLKSPSRFIYDMPLWNDAPMYKRDAWRREHDLATFAPPVRFVVTPATASVEHAAMRVRGYETLVVDGDFVVFELPRQTPEGADALLSPPRAR